MSTAPSKLTGEFAIVEESVRRHGPGFSTFGFELADVTLAGSPALQVFPMFHFANKKSGLSIDMSFFPSRQGKNGGFNVLIVGRGNRKLSLKEYLRAHHKPELAEDFNYRSPADIREFCETVLNELLNLMATDLKPILDGKVWEETPIDWMGYK